MDITVRSFGFTKNKEEVFIYTLKNEKIEVEILNYGGIIKKILTPDKNGNWENIVLGFDTLEEYEINEPYFGCITGRVAGRIKEGKLTIDNKLYSLEINNGSNNIHGGINSLNTKVWAGTVEKLSDKGSIILTYHSPHLENGFPGAIDFTVKYTLENENLTISYIGEADRNTYINLTNHSYFNLSGNQKRNIYDSFLTLSSENFLEVDTNTLPIKIKKTEDSIFDFRNGQLLGEVLTKENKDTKIVGGGIDHGFILEKACDLGGFLKNEISGREMSFKTDQPTVVIYTGNYLKEKHLGICFETQDYPDIFNLNLDNINIYSPNKNYTQNTTFTFKTSK
ncbi:MAG: aldose epimerase family protein [Fusobacteriaceae bacterium]